MCSGHGDKNNYHIETALAFYNKLRYIMAATLQQKHQQPKNGGVGGGKLNFSVEKKIHFISFLEAAKQVYWNTMQFALDAQPHFHYIRNFLMSSNQYGMYWVR